MIKPTGKIDHINLTVPNIEEAISYYTSKLNFTLRDRYEKNGLQFIFLTDGNTVYEIMENPNLREAYIDHIAYVSEDIEADYNYYKQLDSSLLLGPIGYVDFLFEEGVYYFFIKGVCGEKIEFCQKKRG